MLTLSPVDLAVLSLMSEKNAEFVKRSDLIADLWTIKGSRKMSVVTVTDPKLLKSAPMSLANAVKVAYSAIQVGTDYENVRNNENERNGLDRDVAGGNWHHPVKNPNNDAYTPFCEHNKTGEWYLRYVLDRVIESRFIDKVTGAEIAKDDIAPYLPKKSSNPAGFFTYKMDSIAAFNANGKSAIVVAG